MNAGPARAATAFGLRRRGAVHASDVDAVRTRATGGRLFRAHDAGDNAAVLVDADLGYASRLDQALRRSAEPLVEGRTQVKLKVRIAHWHYYECNSAAPGVCCATLIRLRNLFSALEYQG